MKRNILKCISLVLTLMMFTTAFVFAAATVPSDVKGTVYEEAVTALEAKGIITGDTDGKFYPDSQLTRAQACIIVVKTMNPPISEVIGTPTQLVEKSGFKDMTGYGWAEGYVSYAVKQGVTKGYTDGTFKPGNNVTTNELITMILRAADYSDEILGGTWPSNYVAKAKALELLGKMPVTLPTYATKWMAAQLDYNALKQIEAANPPDQTPAQGTGNDKPAAVPDASVMTYTAGSFDSSVSTFAGKEILGNVKLYTYGSSAAYSKAMTFSGITSDYRLDNVDKYRNVKTPAFYLLKDNLIVSMIVPTDVGYTGKAYGVINSVVTTINADGEAVKGFETLTATKKVTWLGEEGLGSIPAKSEYLNGEVYEMNLSDAQMHSIYKASDSSKRNKSFEELSNASAAFADVESFNENVVKIAAADGGAIFTVKSNASVYVLDAGNPTEYRTGSISSIKAGVEIRAYDVLDDDEESADVIVVRK